MPCGGLTDHDNERRARAIRIREAAPAEHRNAERLEVVRSDDVHIEHRVGGRLLRGLSFSRRPPVPCGCTCERDRHNGRDAAHTRDRAQLRQHPLEQCALFRRVVVLIGADCELPDQQVRCLEGELGPFELDQGSGHEPGCREDDQRECDLPHDQTLGRKPGAPAAALPCVGSQGLLRLDARAQDRRPEAEQQDGDACDDDGARERRRVQVNLVQAWQPRRRERDESPHGGRRQRDAEGAAGDGEKAVLDHQFYDDLPATGAERGAHRDLPRPPDAADEQQVRDVDARDQEQQRGRGGEREQRRPHVAQDEPRQRVHHAAQITLPRRGLGAAQEGGQLGPGVGSRCARREPPDHVERDK